MARSLRIEYEHAFYHVLSRGNEQKAIFRQTKDYQRFLEILRECRQRFRVNLHSYCLMTNHFHLLIETEEANLSLFMQRLLGVYTIQFNRKYKRVGHLFQGRYKSYVIDQESYLLELSRYIHLNPCRAGLVKRPEHYRWSSMREYLGQEKPEATQTEMILAELGSPGAYEQFVIEGLQLEKESRFDPSQQVVGGAILGSTAFVEEMRKKAREKETREISREREIFRTEPELLKRVLKGEEDDIVIYGLWKWGRLTQREIGGLYAKTHSAISHAVKRLERRMEKDRNLRSRIERFEDRVSSFKG